MRLWKKKAFGHPLELLALKQHVVSIEVQGKNMLSTTQTMTPNNMTTIDKT